MFLPICKNATYWALDENTGAIVWSRTVGPRVTGGNFRALDLDSSPKSNRFYTSSPNELVEAARDSLLIGTSLRRVRQNNSETLRKIALKQGAN